MSDTSNTQCAYEVKGSVCQSEMLTLEGQGCVFDSLTFAGQYGNREESCVHECVKHKCAAIDKSLL